MKSKLILGFALAIGLVGCTRENEQTQVKIDKDSVQTGASIDIDRYGYDQRKDFENLISQRLDVIERGIDSLKKNVKLGVIDGSGTNSASKPSEAAIVARERLISRVEKEQDQFEDRVDDIADAKREDWDQLKIKFRDELVQIESTYQGLLTARQ